MAIFKEFLHCEHLYDAHILTEDGFRFPIHRVLFCMKSEYFRNLLYDPSTNVILVPGIRGSIMEIIRDYIYTGNMNSTEQNISDILVASFYLGIENLNVKPPCWIISMKGLISTTNCVPLCLATSKIEQQRVFKASCHFIIVNFQDVVGDRNSKFEDLPAEFLERFLASDSLNVSNERQVWNVITLWIDKAPDERKICLKNLIRHIRFSAADSDLTSEIVNHPLVLESMSIDELEAIIMSNSSLKLRNPKMFFFFTKFYFGGSGYPEGIEIFITYDDHVDFWRNISLKTILPNHVVHGLGPKIMLFYTFNNVIHAFDIVSKTLLEISPPGIRREEYSVVKVGHCIYVLGGYNDASGDDVVMTGERYDCNLEIWEFIKPHYAFNEGKAVAMNNTIYFIGANSGFRSDIMTAQVYSPDEDSWEFIKPPRVFRHAFALVVHVNQLVILGGCLNYQQCVTSVEVYISETDSWREYPDLPSPYYCPGAVSMLGVLYVYDKSSDEGNDRHPPAFWNAAVEQWEVVGPSSPYRDLHEYKFCVVEDPDVIMEIRGENRDPATKWEESPFF